MKVQCKSCSAQYEIDDSRIPPEGLQIQCPRCATTFVINQQIDLPDDAEIFDLGNSIPAPGAGDSLELDLPQDPLGFENKPPSAIIGNSTLPALGVESESDPLAVGSSLPPIGGSDVPGPGADSELPPLDLGSSLPPIDSTSAMPSPGADSELPPLDLGSSLPPLDLESAPTVSARQQAVSPFDSPPSPDRPLPQPANEGQIFDFIDNEIGSDVRDVATPSEKRYRIRRKSGKVFGPFDIKTVKKMLADNQLMGNEEASSDGTTFHPLGSINEFAEVIRALMDEPVLVSGTKPVASPGSIQSPKAVEGAAPKVSSDASAKTMAKKSRSLPRWSIMLISFIGAITVAGFGLGFTDYGYFGYRLFISDQHDPTQSGTLGTTNPQIRNYYLQDTYFGYTQVAKSLASKIQNNPTIEDLYLLSLSYVALLRNYGANASYFEKSKATLDKLKDLAGQSNQTSKAEGAWLTLTEPKKASEILAPLVAKGSKDKEALFLAGWAQARQKKWRRAAAFFDLAIVQDANYTKAYHALGEIQALQGDLDNALHFYKLALEKNPQHVNSAVEIARLAIINKRDWELGEKMLTIAFGPNKKLLSPSEQATAHSLRAKLHTKRNENAKATEDLRAAVSLMPTQIKYMAKLGSHYMDLGNYTKARELFDQALARDPNNLEAKIGKGRALWKNGDIVQAKVLFEKLVQQANQDPRPLFYLGSIFQDLEKQAEATKTWNKAIQLAPKYLEPRVALARQKIEQGNLFKALDHLTRAAKIDPQSTIVHVGLGEVYLQQKNYRLAITEFKEALRLDPDFAQAHFNLANAYRDQSKYDEAEKEYAITAKLAPGHSDLNVERGYNLLLQGKTEAALRLFEEAIRKKPKDDRLYVRAGLAANALGQKEAAIRYLQSAIGVNNNNSQALFELGKLFQEKNDNDQATSLLRQASQLDKKNAEIHYHLALSYQALEMYQDAMDEFRQAIKIKPNHIKSLLRLGQNLADRDQFGQAIEYYRRVLKQQPNQVEVMLALAQVYSQQQQYKKALSVLKQALKKQPHANGIAYQLGRTYEELNRRKKAIKYYQMAARIDNRDPMPHFYLGYVFKALNRNRKALAEFRRYLDLRPDAPDLDEVQEEIYYLQQ